MTNLMINSRKEYWFLTFKLLTTRKSQTIAFASILIFTLCNLFSKPVFAQTGLASEQIDQADFLSEVPIVSSATRLNQKITEVPASITIIDREMIEASGATEIPQLFRLVPGYISYYVFGNQFGVTNRGLTIEFPGDLEVMIDGRSVYEPIFSAVEWSSLGITVEDIDYIEVLRGSNTPAYGSNAYLGAINIVTANPVKAHGTNINVTLGDLHTRNTQIRQNGSLGVVNYSLGVSYRSNEGFPRLKKQANPIPFDRIQDSNEALHLNLRLIYTPTVFDTIDFQMGVGKSDLDIPGNDLTDGPNGFNEREIETNFQFIQWRKSLQNTNEIQLQLYHNRLAVDEIRELGPLSGLLSVPPSFIPLIFDGHADEDIVTGIRDTVSERFDVELQHKLNLTEHQRLVWGAGVRYDKIRSEFLLGRKDAVDEFQYRLFANWEWRLGEKLTFNFGAMSEHNNIVGNFISPRAAVNYQFLPGQVIHSSYTYGNRTPSVLESSQFQATSFADGTLIDVDINYDDNIDESKVREVEIGYLGNFLNSKLTVDLRAFRTETDRVIGEVINLFPDLSGDVHTVSNTMDWVSKGIDTQIQFRPSNTILLSLQYAYTDFHGNRFKRVEPLEIPALDRELPRHNANLLVSKTFKHGWNASFVWYYVSEVAWRQGDLIKSQDRLDLRLAKTFNIGARAAKAELIVHNLLNDYPEFEDFNLFETRVFLRLSINLP